MYYNPEIHNRKTIRLKDYDYSKEGMYYITICTNDRDKILGSIIDTKVKLSVYGEIVNKEWLGLERRFRSIKLHAYVIMPNHIHAIIELKSMNKNILGDIIKTYKSMCSKKCNQLNKVSGITIWQRNFHEYVIRNEKDYYIKYEYIINNPYRWNEDDLYID